MRESDFQKKVTACAKKHGWLIRTERTHHSAKRRGHHVAGFPDLYLVHPSGYIIQAELKTTVGNATPQQQEWLNAMWNTEDALKSPRYRVRLWRPNNWWRIEAALRREDNDGGQAERKSLTT